MDVLYSQSLTFPPWFLLTVILLFPFLSLIFLVKHKNKLANLPPSPPGFPIIGNLHQLGEIPHRLLCRLSKKYGPVMLLQLGQVPTLVVSSPDMAKEVMKKHDIDSCSRPSSHGTKRLTYNQQNLAFSPYSDYWKEMRKLCVIELFTIKRVQSFWRIRDQEVTRLINSLTQTTPNPVNLGEKIFSLTNTVMCRVAFGKSYEEKQFEGFEESIAEAMTLFSCFWGADFFPFMGWIIDVFNGYHGRLEKCFHDFDSFFDRLLEDLNTRRPNSENEGIIDILLRLSKDETAAFRITKDQIKAVLMDIFVGGIDTSSITMVWAMSELIRNPRVMKKVQTEIRGCIGRKSKVDETEVEKLTYLKMVVKETFRLHPPATLLLPRETMQHCKIGGYNVYPKTRILVNVWAIGRDAETWKNPDEFYPERFEDSAIDFRGQHFELLPFGAGRRMCPAITMGVTTVELTLANLLHCFNWELPSGMKREDISMEEKVGLAVHKKSPLYLVPLKHTW